MPVLRRSIVNSLTKQHQQQHVDADTTSMGEGPTIEEVFVIEETGELCASYDEYLERVTLYHQPVWTCRLTGHTGMNYYEALRSEQEARRSLEDFPEWWKPYVLTMTHCSREALDALTGRIAAYCKGHLALNEPVSMSFNGQLLRGLVSDTPPFKEPESAAGGSFSATQSTSASLMASGDHLSTLSAHSLNSSTASIPRTSTSYKIAINDGDMIISGACQRPEDVIRQFSPPSKSLLKKYIRSVATRYGHAGMPWLVHTELVNRFGITKELPPELAERIKQLQQLRNERERAVRPRSFSLSLEKAAVADNGNNEDDGIKYPILDETLPESKQNDPSGRPQPRAFPTGRGIPSYDVAALLELWQFIGAFGVSSLEVAPMSLSHLIKALEWKGEVNPIVEAICLGFLSQLSRTVRTSKSREERIEEYLGGIGESQCFLREANSTNGNDDDLTEISFALIDDFVNGQLSLSRREPKPWFIRVTAYLWELRVIPEVSRHLLKMAQGGTGFHQLPSANKLQLLGILRNFYLTAVSLRSAVDREVEAGALVKHDIREAEGESRRLVRQTQELLGQQEALQAQLEPLEGSPPPLSVVKRLKREIRELETDLAKVRREESRLARRLEALRKRQYDHGAVRVRLLGEDRDWRRYWWFDGHLKPEDVIRRGSGVIIVEEPTVVPGHPVWSYYDEMSQVENLLAHLNPLGCRESRLAAALEDTKDRLAQSIAPFHVQDEEGTPADRLKDGEQQQQKEQEEEEEEEEMIVVKRRNASYKSKIGRQTAASKGAALPIFLRYRNSFNLVGAMPSK